MLQIKTFPAGPLDTNAYLVFDDRANEALLIDAPYGATEDILAAISSNSLELKEIVLTHAHWDHIADAEELRTKTKAPLKAHELCLEHLANPSSAVFELPFEITPVTVDGQLAEGDVVKLAPDHEFLVMHLPGHDPGHIVLYSAKDAVIMGGDVLFPNGHGRIDIPGASAEDMRESLTRLAPLPPETTVYPGHGQPTAIGNETWLQSS